jgi:hypothetical protein
MEPGSRPLAIAFVIGAVLAVTSCEPYGCRYVPAILADLAGTAIAPSGDEVPIVDRSAVGGSPPNFEELRRAALLNLGTGALHVVWHQWNPQRREIITAVVAIPYPLEQAETLQVESLVPEGNPVRLPGPPSGGRFAVHAWLDSGTPSLLSVDGFVVVEQVRPLRFTLSLTSRADGGIVTRLAGRVEVFEGRVPLTCPD